MQSGNDIRSVTAGHSPSAHPLNAALARGHGRPAMDAL